MLLERAGQTARILDVHHHALTQLEAHQVVETALWIAVVRACSGFEPFMKRHRPVTPPTRWPLSLILERAFPRSVALLRSATMRPLRHRLARVRRPSRHPPGDSHARALRVLEALVARARPAVQAGTLHELLTRVVDETHAICDEIGRELLGSPPPAAADEENQ